MTETLVSYELAVLLKEKGFNIKTQYYYSNGKKAYDKERELYKEILTRDGIDKCKKVFKLNHPLWCAGLLNDGTIYGYDFGTGERLMFPTLSLAQKWLREIHNIHIEIKPTPYNQDIFVWYYDIGIMDINTDINLARKNDYSLIGQAKKIYYTTYEQALEEGLLQGLKLTNI